MSTILYENDKFLKIYQTMKCKGRDYACLFRYPDGWDKPGGMDESIQNFIDSIRQANIQAYNERYADADELAVSLLDFSHVVMPYGSNVQLYQALLSIRYNIDQEDVNDCAKVLNHVIDHVSYEIISNMEAYKTANVW